MSLQSIVNELADNWPAFTYIALMCVTSLFFLRERRAETRLLKRLGRQLQAQMRKRFDQVESELRKQRRRSHGTVRARRMRRRSRELPRVARLRAS
jgi:hypothetical protein